ncbi:MAG: SIMPL domain-containing protein [Acidimicrobiales bacterium]|nr:SIMPL domain-containing protein [Acidimicrobiales bacterium]
MVRIEVVGEGTAVAQPDYAALTFTVVVRDGSARAAASSAETGAASLIDMLDRAGVANDDRGAQSATVHRRTRWHGDREVFEGWEAVINVACTVRDPNRAYDLVEDVTAAADVALSGPHWVVEPSNAAHDRARARAFEEGVRKAESYANAAGLSLGDLKEISEGTGAGGSPSRRLAASSPEAMTAALEPASQTVGATVTLLFDAE